MSQIVLYSGEMFTGSYENYATEIQDYQGDTSLSHVKSLKVSSGIWIVYSEKDFSGDIAVYKAGNYGYGLKIKTVGSFRRFSGQLENPEIIVSDQTDYQGSHQVLKVLKDTEYQTVRPPIVCYKVVNGVWLLYYCAGLRGKCIVLITGDEMPDESKPEWTGPIQSLKAYLTYEGEKP